MKTPAANSTFAIGGVSCSADSLVVAESFVLRIKFSGKNPAHRKSANRYGAFMIRQLTTLVLFILTSKICFGQFNYSAVLVDRISNEPVSFVIVRTFINADTVSVSTDIDGRFTLTNLTTGRHRIIATELGYSLLDTTLLLVTHRNSDTLKCNGPNLNGRTVRLGYNKNVALADIKGETIFLLLPGGIVGTKINSIDTLFEHKYNLKYISRGCTRFSSDNETEYNQTIFNYLDKKYGKAWRREVRQDIIGLRK